MQLGRAELFACFALLLANACVAVRQNVPDASGTLEVIHDAKEWKKIMESKTNVLVIFTLSTKPIPARLRTALQQANIESRGIGTIVHVPCGTAEGRKLCRKSKDLEAMLEQLSTAEAGTADYVLKHYKSGEFHKNFDRLETARSIVNFMRDPSGPVPFEEDASMQSVLNIEGLKHFEEVVMKSRTPVAVYIYTPWCIECQRGRAPLALAANDVKGQVVVAALNAEAPVNSAVRERLNLAGYPSLVYFENGLGRFAYSGMLSREGITEWLRRPTPARLAEQSTNEQLAAQRSVTPDYDWQELDKEEADELGIEGSLRTAPIRIRTLDDRSFAAAISSAKSIVVLFYAPWCPHSKRLKPEFQKAALLADSKGISAEFYAVNGDKNEALIQRLNVQTYPSVRYYLDGQYLTDVNERKAEKIVSLLSSPMQQASAAREAGGQSTEFSADDDLVQLLGLDTFKNVRKRKHAFIMFFAPWCAHCHTAKTHFAKAAGYFKPLVKVQFFALDCTESASLCEQHNVTAFPSFLYFQYGRFIDAFAPETQPEISNFVEFLTERASADIAEVKLASLSEYLSSIGPLPPPATLIQHATGGQLDDLLNDSGSGSGASAGANSISQADVDAVKAVIMDGNQHPALFYVYREQCYACFETVQRLSYMMNRLKEITPVRVAFVALSLDKFSKFDAREIAALLEVKTLPSLHYFKYGAQVELPIKADLESARHVAWSDRLLEYLAQDLSEMLANARGNANREEL